MNIEEQVGLLRVGLGLDDEDSEVAKNILQIILDQQRQEHEHNYVQDQHSKNQWVCSKCGDSIFR